MTEGNENTLPIGKHINEVEFAPTPDGAPAIGDTKALSKEAHVFKVVKIARDSGDPNVTILVCESEFDNSIWTIDARAYIDGDTFDDSKPTEQAEQTKHAEHTENNSDDNDNSDKAPRVGERYTHFKSPEDFYSILYIATNSSNPNEQIVVYQSSYTHPQLGPNPIWVREINDFIGYKKYDDGTKIRRFTKVS